MDFPNELCMSSARRASRRGGLACGRSHRRKHRRVDGQRDLEYLGRIDTRLEHDTVHFAVSGLHASNPFVAASQHVIRVIELLHAGAGFAMHVRHRQPIGLAPLIAEEQVRAPLGAPPDGEALTLAIQAALTPSEFTESIRAAARRLGRLDASQPSAAPRP